MVRIVLAVGSRAGLAAPLQTGYYMIGRHKECQIRPKSRSVSRRHCLLHNEDGVLRLFDLNSTAGTFKNDKRVESGKWHEVGDRDEVRCGKVLFVVAFGVADVPANLEEVEGRRQDFERSDTQSDKSILRGTAWQDVDVAGFLESEDQVDREIRYQNIRSSEITAHHEVEFEIETQAEQEEVTSENHSVKGGSEKVKKEEKIAAKNNQFSGKIRPMKSAKKSGLAAWSVGQGDLLERGKIAGLTFLAATVLTFFCYNIYSFYSGPEAKVLQEID
jgi:pSer/pThr/pTyr-binding forkhead associated (FHA) protein